jgi:hypothetical protein
MRSVPFDLVIYDDEDTRDAEGRAMSRRSGAVVIADEPAMGSHRSLAWLTGLARRRPAARARRAAA